MARRQRRRSGIFDPDYRKAGWNRSIFAPKNSSMSITQLSATLTVILFLLILSQPSMRQITLTTPGIAAAGGAFLIVWIFIGVTIRKLAWRMVRHHALTETAQVSAPVTVTQRYAKPAARSDVTANRADALTERQQRLSAPDDSTRRGREFEQEVAQLLNVLTSYKAVAVGGGGDGGVDVKVYAGDRLVGIVQCKHYRAGQALAPGHIRELYAVKQQFGVKTAYLATTAHFSESSRDEARRLGVKLLDGDDIQRMKGQAQARLRGRDERSNAFLA